jgi:hypothetical protein
MLSNSKPEIKAGIGQRFYCGNSQILLYSMVIYYSIAKYLPNAA